MLWVPPTADIAEGRVAANAAASRLVDRELQKQLEIAKRFTAELKLIDPLLEMVFISKPPDAGDGAPFGIVWNRWHVLRRNPDSAWQFMPVTDSEGGYVEPTSRVFDKLRSSDLWNGDARRKFMRERAEEAARKQRNLDALREEARDEIAWKLKALENPGIRFGGTGWTARAGARKAA